MPMNVLFVDDEANILSGLRRMLRGQRSKWDMEFVSSGGEALEILDSKPIDVIVTDMRMPCMNGAELLSRVSQISPRTVRLVLSGQSEQENILRSIGPAHQYMSKPCDAEILIGTIERTYHVQSQLEDESLRRIITQVSFLPSLPDLYRRLVVEMNSDNSSMDQIGDLISTDLALSAKVLQLVNSSFFGLAQHVSSPKHASSLLGLNIIRPLVLFAGAYTQCEKIGLGNYSLSSLIDHSLSVAMHARSIATFENQSAFLIDDAFIAGMMHDLGKLILVVNLKDRYAEILDASNREGISLWQLEKEALKTTHAEVGAHLLGLWGFNSAVVEAVAFHHQPQNCAHSEFAPLSAVYFANRYAYQQSSISVKSKPIDPKQLVDLLEDPYLKTFVDFERLIQWGKLSNSKPS